MRLLNMNITVQYLKTLLHSTPPIERPLCLEVFADCTNFSDQHQISKIGICSRQDAKFGIVFLYVFAPLREMIPSLVWA
jgi:hypothetical protein